MSERFQEIAVELPVASPDPEWQTARTPAYLGHDGDAARELAGKRVVVVAAGSVGWPLAALHARLGVGNLDVVDPKRIKHQSLLTHQGVRPEDLGEFKARAAARTCSSLGTGTRVRYFVGEFQQLSPADLVGADVVIMSPDNLAAELAVGQMCLHLGIPLIHASVHGETLVAQVRVYANTGPQSPTPACGFTPAEREMLNGQVRFSCEGPAAGSVTPQVSGPATVSPANLCSIAADLATTQCLRLLLGLGEPVGDSHLEWCGFTQRTAVSPLACRGDCQCDHARFGVVRLPRPLGGYSLADLAAQDGDLGGEGACTFVPGDLAWAERGICRCGRRQSIGRFVHPSKPRAGNCPKCGEPIFCAPFFLHRRVSESLIAPVRDKPLRELGGIPPEWLLARTEHAGTLFLNPDPKP